MTTEIVRCKRVAPGVYETPEGHQIRRAYDENLRPKGWNLIGPDGEWWDTYATKAEAIEYRNA